MCMIELCKETVKFETLLLKTRVEKMIHLCCQVFLNGESLKRAAFLIASPVTNLHTLSHRPNLMLMVYFDSLLETEQSFLSATKYTFRVHNLTGNPIASTTYVDFVVMESIQYQRSVVGPICCRNAATDGELSCIHTNC